MKIYHIFNLILFSFLIVACGSTKKTTLDDPPSHQEAIVQLQDFSGLSGCKAMLVTTKGV